MHALPSAPSCRSTGSAGPSHRCPAAVRSRLARGTVLLRAKEDDDDKPPEIPNTGRTALEATIRRKQKQVEAVLKELGNEALEDRLQSAMQVPANPPYRLTTLIAESAPQGKAVLVFELMRPSPASTSQELAQLAERYVAMGADALVVRVDAEDTPSGMGDLWAICQAVGRKVPVLSRDWLIHPLQIVEAKEAGAAGCIGVIAQVNGRGTVLMSSFAARLGIDAPVEVVNLMELEGLSKAGVAFFGMNLGVGISLALPGFASKVADGLLGKMPFGSVSMVGCRTVEEARKARLGGADCILVKKELIDVYGPKNLRLLAQELQYITSGDD